MNTPRIARAEGLLAGLFMLAACPSAPPTPFGDTDAQSDSDDDDGGSETSDPTSDDASDSADSATGPVDGSGEVDILFVVDNTGSMGPVQARLQAAAAAFGEALENSGLDYRIGVTTTDNGNYWCTSTSPEAGKLVDTGCRERLEEFQFPALELDEQQTACLDGCSVDGLSVGAPWIEGIGDSTNLGGGVSLADGLACLLPQGIAGCGFEAHLESAYKALRRSETEDEPSYGFMRDAAHLAIVFVSDELDCSYNGDWVEIFDENGAKRFWSNPTDGSPTSAICFNAGVRCDGTSCMPVDLDIDGNETAVEEDAVMSSLKRYAGYFGDLASAKAVLGGRIGLFGILGVPPGYDGELSYTMNDATSVANFGLDPGCSDAEVTAIPPVRMRQLAEVTGSPAGPRLFSVCDGDYGSALTTIVDELVALDGAG